MTSPASSLSLSISEASDENQKGSNENSAAHDKSKIAPVLTPSATAAPPAPTEHKWSHLEREDTPVAPAPAPLPPLFVPPANPGPPQPPPLPPMALLMAAASSSGTSNNANKRDRESGSDGDDDSMDDDSDDEESSEDEMDSLNDDDGFRDEGESSMDDEEYSRHCRQRTITSNRGHNRASHDVRGCRSVDNFVKLNMISEGTYGRVWRAQQTLRNGRTKINALKQVKMEKEKEGFPLTALREINVLLTLQHPNIVNVEEIVVGTRADNIFLVMEYVEHDLKYLMETMKARFSQAEVKCLLVQLLTACSYMHDNWVIHRDLKTSNLLYANNGVLKVCDFGLARLYGEPVKKMTPLVVTLWYRSPEILFGEDSYTPVVDMWSVGCIFAELLQKEPLFPGKTEIDMVNKIFAQLGTPTDENWPEFDQLPSAKKFSFAPSKGVLRETFPAASMYSERPSLTENGFDLLSRLLSLNPKSRITASEALNHPYFLEVPPPQSVSMMPTFRATNEEPRKKKKKGADDPNRETKKALGVA